MHIDLSNTTLARAQRAEGHAEGQLEARRQAVRQFVNVRFHDPALADRAASVPDGLLEQAIDVAAAAADAGDIARWLESLAA